MHTYDAVVGSVTYDYFSDRTQGPRPRTDEDVGPRLWAAIFALLETGIEGGGFARDFPIRCEDGGIYDCDRNGLMATMRAEIPDLGDHLTAREVPSTLSALDLLEFMYRHASQATDGRYHSFFDHYHLRFDRDKGLREFRASVNRVLARSGSVYELNDRGHIERLVPPAVAAAIRRDLPPTKDHEFDELLDLAATKYLDPDPAVRREGLEKLWDAFERAKTVLDGDKRTGVRKLIDTATNGAAAEEANLLEQEMTTLTTIGNTFRIRHHETTATQPTVAAVDHLFVRMYACLLRVHSALR